MQECMIITMLFRLCNHNNNKDGSGQWKVIGL